MESAAAGKKVFCKVSALVEGTRKTKGDAPAEVAPYKPVLDALWAIFGEDRLIYGSNWPVSERAADYATVERLVIEYFRTKGATASEKFFAQNAQAAYKWAAR